MHQTPCNVAVNQEVSNYVRRLQKFIFNSHIIQIKHLKQPWRAQKYLLGNNIAFVIKTCIGLGGLVQQPLLKGTPFFYRPSLKILN